MQLEVGEYYLSAGGEVVAITSFRDNEVFDCNHNPYSKHSGRFMPKAMESDLSKYDLIAHIPKELHLHILNEINIYYTDSIFKSIVDNVYK